MIKYYPFELHNHTKHSDGSFTPEELCDALLKRGVKGFAITDHNTISGQKFCQIEADKAGLVLLNGIESTTFYGHITVIGEESKNVDWRTFNPETIYKIASGIKEKGSLIGIAHPFRIGYPICTGGQDEWCLNDYKPFTHYEVWSGPNPYKDITNRYGLERYIELSEKGNKLACVYGRDFHSKCNTEIATTATFLGIEGELSVESALDAIKKRRTYISTNTQMSIELIGNKVYNIGEDVKKGNYQLKGKVSVLNEKVKTEFTKVKLKGSAHSEGFIELNEDGSFLGNIKLEAGILLIEVEGKLEGEHSKLVITTPFYVE